MDPITALIVSVSSGLIVASVTGLVAYARGKRKGTQEGNREGREKGKQEGREEYKRHCESHVSQYSELLGNKIREAYKTDRDNFETLIVRAKTIVKVRNDLKEDLDDLRSLLNSTIDDLSKLLESDETTIRNNQGQIRILVGVLNESWDTKGPQIKVKLRALLAKLGIFQNDMKG